MRTTVTIDDTRYRQAIELAEPGTDKSDLLREAVKAYVRLQAAQRLAALGSSSPQMPSIHRRQPCDKTR